MSNEINEIFKDMAIFSSLDQPHLELIKEQITVENLESGENLFEEGVDGEGMYIVTHGNLEVLKKNKDGNNVKIVDRGVGSLIGMTSLFVENKKRSATLRATEKTIVWKFTKENFLKLLQSRGDVAFNFLAYMSKEFREISDSNLSWMSNQGAHCFRLCVFDAKKYEQEAFSKLQPDDVDIQYIDTKLTPESVSLAKGANAVCIFVNDVVNRAVLEKLASFKVKLVALRCAGFNNVDLEAAQELGISVARVPAYSPYAVAEHALALMMTLNRKTHKAYNRTREGNFYLNRLVGFDMHGRTAGVIGTGKIGKCMANILVGMGMKVIAWDAYPDEAFAKQAGMEYVELDTLLEESDVITLHVPLLPSTHHLIDDEAIQKMKDGVMLINTSRGGLVNTIDLIQGLKEKKIGSAGLDVYEEEKDYFFSDHTGDIIGDDTLARLISFPNVLVTSHQAFLTSDALENIADTTLGNVREFREGKQQGELTNAVLPAK